MSTFTDVAEVPLLGEASKLSMLSGSKQATVLSMTINWITTKIPLTVTQSIPY